MASFETINASTNVRSETLSFTDEQGATIIVPHSLFEDLIQPPELNLQSLIRELEDTKKAESRYLWHSITLSEYWKVKRIPRGLRINKTPSFGLDDATFMKKWEQVLNKCSLDLMLLIIEKTKCEKDKLSKEIDRIETELKTKMDGEKMKEVTSNISTILTTYVKEIRSYKMKKYERDTKDYADGTVFDWQGRKRRSFPHFRPPPPRNIKQLTLSTASERDSSEDMSDIADSTKSRPFLARDHPRQRRRRGEEQGGRGGLPPQPTRWSPRYNKKRP